MSDRSSTDPRGAGWLRRIAKAATPARGLLVNSSGASPVAVPQPSPKGEPVQDAAGASSYALGLPFGMDVRPAEAAPVIIAVGGGKGGVGKSLVSANLAARVAMSGLRVLAIDCDLGGSNLHTYFGLPTPRVSLADIMRGAEKRLADAAVASGVVGLDVVAGGRDELWGSDSAGDLAAHRRLLNAIIGARSELNCDVVVLDLGAGSQRYTTDLFSLAHLGLITVLPEPTSIENAYLFLRAWLTRMIASVGQRTRTERAAEEVQNFLFESSLAEGPARSTGYADKLQQLSTVHPEYVELLRRALTGRLVGFAVNQVRSQKDIDIGKSMAVIGERYFGFCTSFCGYLTHDDAAWKSLRNRRLLLTDFPQSTLARRIGDLSQTVLARAVQVHTNGG